MSREDEQRHQVFREMGKDLGAHIERKRRSAFRKDLASKVSSLCTQGKHTTCFSLACTCDCHPRAERITK